MKIGYGRVSTDEQNVETQRQALIELGVDRRRIHLDRGVSGRRRQRPALDRALAELRDGDEFVVTKLDRLGRSLRDLLDIADQIRREGASLTVGRTTYDPADPVGAMMFQVLGMTAEFEVAMNRERTREGVARAKAEGKYRGRQPKLSLDRSRSGGHPEMSGEFPQDRGSGLWDLLVGASLPSTRPTR
ncbi:recombinase family protein [Gordonia sp. LUNF6]|uniref:recombinase family protein n=1 Tax=Gordonia sp. LUNF6 TaxID=3388658 RepID=UPI00399A798E